MTEMRALIDDQAFDLMKHRRVGLVGVAAVGAARMMIRIGGFCDSMVRTCTGEVWVRSSMRVPSGFGLKKNVSCMSRAGWFSGKLSLVKL